MASETSSSKKDLWDDLNIDYEKAYQNNPFQIASIKTAISLLKPGSRILDVGCGTGIPVSQMLAEAGMGVTGIDIAPNMVECASQRVKGSFETADMRTYEPRGEFEGIFIMFSHLSLSYAAFHAAAFKFAKALAPGGILAVGQCPSDEYLKEGDDRYDETGTYVEGYNLPFYGQPFDALMLSRRGQLDFLRSMGLEIVEEIAELFQPDDPRCDAEQQQYVIARHVNDQPLQEPKPSPKC